MARLSVCLIGLLVVLATSFAAAKPRVLTVTGTRKEVAEAIGRQTKASIATRLARDDVQKQIKPFLKTTVGSVIMEELVSRATAVFPKLVGELRALAHGSGHSFEDIFILNALQELTSYTGNTSAIEAGQEGGLLAKQRPTSTVSHCTDILSQPDVGVLAGIWGHNEDGGVGDQPLNYFVNATIYFDSEGSSSSSSSTGRNGEEIEERFIAYCYAGTVGGLAYGWNHHGLVMSENAIFATRFNYLGVPVSLLGRAILAERSIDEAIDLVRWHHGSESFNLNLGHYPSGRMVSLEVDPFTYTMSPKEIFNQPRQRLFPGLSLPPTMFIHVNFFQVLNSPCFPDTSSQHRLATLTKNYRTPNATSDIATMLGDTSDPIYPVYRTNTTYDNCDTLTTAVWDLRIGTVAIYDSNPAHNPPAYLWVLGNM